MTPYRPREPYTNPHPVDELEPLDAAGSEYRLAAKKLAYVLEAVFSFVEASHNPRAANLQWAKAMGLPAVRDRSVTSLAATLGVSKQNLSKGITRFLAMSGLPPSLDLKTAAACRTYRCRPIP